MTPSPYFCHVEQIISDKYYSEEPRFICKKWSDLKGNVRTSVMDTHHHILSHLDTGRSLDHASCFVHNCPHIGDQI